MGMCPAVYTTAVFNTKIRKLRVSECRSQGPSSAPFKKIQRTMTFTEIETQGGGEVNCTMKAYQVSQTNSNLGENNHLLQVIKETIDRNVSEALEKCRGDSKQDIEKLLELRTGEEDGIWNLDLASVKELRSMISSSGCCNF